MFSETEKQFFWPSHEKVARGAAVEEIFALPTRSASEGGSEHARGHLSWSPSVPPPAERHAGTMHEHVRLCLRQPLRRRRRGSRMERLRLGHGLHGLRTSGVVTMLKHLRLRL